MANSDSVYKSGVRGALTDGLLPLEYKNLRIVDDQMIIRDKFGLIDGLKSTLAA